jgi:hypothetical protein
LRIYQRCLSRRQCTFLLRVRKYRLHLVSKRNISISCISVVPTLFQDPPHQVPRARALSNMKRCDVQVRRRDDARHVQYEDGEQPCTPITPSYKCGQELYNTSRSQGVRYATCLRSSAVTRCSWTSENPAVFTSYKRYYGRPRSPSLRTSYVPTGIVLVKRSLVFPNDHIALVTDKRPH